MFCASCMTFINVYQYLDILFLHIKAKSWGTVLKDQDAFISNQISKKFESLVFLPFIGLIPQSYKIQDTRPHEVKLMCFSAVFGAFMSLSTLLKFPLLLQLKLMEVKHVGGKRTSVKVSRCVFDSSICFTPQLTALAVTAWITRTTAAFST